MGEEQKQAADTTAKTEAKTETSAADQTAKTDATDTGTKTTDQAKTSDAKAENFFEAKTDKADAAKTDTAKADSKAVEITEEAIGSFIGQIPAVDIGTGADGKPIPFDQAAIKAIAPVMMKHGIKADQAKDIITAYAEHAKTQATAQTQQENTLVAEIQAKTKAELGADLPAFVADAARAGNALFGPELWAFFVNIPAISNDVRFIKALAAQGRATKTDDGAGTGAGGGAASKDFAESWIKSSNRQA